MNAEQRADWLQPGERFRRGHRLYEADRVAVSIDLVVITARQVVDGVPSLLPADIKLVPGEIVSFERAAHVR